MDNNRAFVEAIVDRMKTVLGVSKDKGVSDYFGSSRSLAGVWKNRGSIPLAECIKIALDKNVSLDWLILGRVQAPPAAGDGDGRGTTYADLPVIDLAHFFDGIPEPAWSVPRAWLAQQALAADHTILVRAVDDSMHGTIGAGQLVVVDQRPHASDGVYLVRFGDVVRIKRVQRMVDGSMRLSSDNAAYAVDTIPAGAENPIQILGYCHSVISTIR